MFLLGHCLGGENGLAVSKYYSEEMGLGDIIQIAPDDPKYLDNSISNTQIISLCKRIVSAVLKPIQRPTAQIVNEKLASMIERPVDTECISTMTWKNGYIV